MADEQPPEKPHFDMVRATFYLVAAVFAVYAGAAVISEFVCAFAAIHEFPQPASCGDGKLTEIFTTLLSSALAYAAGRSVAK